MSVCGCCNKIDLSGVCTEVWAKFKIPCRGEEMRLRSKKEENETRHLQKVELGNNAIKKPIKHIILKAYYII